MDRDGSRPEALEVCFPDSPGRSPVRLAPGRRLVVGRAPDCAISIDHPSVSRQHAAIEQRDDGAFVEDLGSRHGTRVNERPLRTGRPVRLEAGDVLQLGPARLRVDHVYERLEADLVDDRASQVQTIMLEPRTGGAEHALRVLVDAVRSIPSDADEEGAGRLMLERMLQATGLERGLVLRLAGGGDVRVVASAGAQLGRVSRSLLAAAQDPDQVAHLSQEGELQLAHSVVGSGVHEALAVRLAVREDDDHFMYLDTRHAAGGVDRRMAEFVGAAARICGFVFESIARRRDEETMRDVRRAREVQERLLPDSTGETSGVRWWLEQRPGALLAGDFAGVAARPDGSCLAWVGDVAGKGAAAAMLMAAAQSWLHAAAARGEPPAQALTGLNEFLHARSAAHEFATLFLAAIGADGSLETCDAGHGLAFLVSGESASVLASEGGPPVGAAPGIEYGSSRSSLAGGDRLLLATDGVHEQRSSEGRLFGIERMVEVLGESRTGAGDVDALMTDLTSFADGRFDDDVTILSVARD